MKPIFTGLSPNAEIDDVLLAGKLLCMPWQWKRGESRSALEHTMRELIGVKHAFAFESGRTSLLMGLSTLALSPHDEVLLQAYTCVAVPNAVRWAGGTPVYVDCDPDALTMDAADLEKKITDRSCAVILQHTFGNPGNLSALLRIARKHNLVIIEDCAHAIGGIYDGKKLGTFGDMAIFSFGRDKAVSSVFGGALTTNDSARADQIRSRYDAAALPSTFWVWQQLLHPLICWLAVQTFSGGVGKIILFFAKKTRLLSRAVLPEERRGEKPSFVGKKMPNALAELAMHQLAKIDRYNAHRLHLAEIYSAAFASLVKSYELRVTSYENGAVPLRYTIQVKRPDDLLLAAKQMSIYLGDWYRHAIAPERVLYDTIGYVSSTCPNAEKASERSLNLPLDIHISDLDAHRIAHCIKSCAHRARS